VQEEMKVKLKQQALQEKLKKAKEKVLGLKYDELIYQAKPRAPVDSHFKLFGDKLDEYFNQYKASHKILSPWNDEEERELERKKKAEEEKIRLKLEKEEKEKPKTREEKIAYLLKMQKIKEAEEELKQRRKKTREKVKKRLSAI
jgi:hypothetical protein